MGFSSRCAGTGVFVSSDVFQLLNLLARSEFLYMDGAVAHNALHSIIQISTYLVITYVTNIEDN